MLRREGLGLLVGVDSEFQADLSALFACHKLLTNEAIKKSGCRCDEPAPRLIQFVAGDSCRAKFHDLMIANILVLGGLQVLESEPIAIQNGQSISDLGKPEVEIGEMPRQVVIAKLGETLELISDKQRETLRE